jgi:hypothetical protein
MDGKKKTQPGDCAFLIGDDRQVKIIRIENYP